MKFEDKFRENAKKYTDEKFSEKSVRELTKIMQSTAKIMYRDAVRNGLSIEYGDEELVLPIKFSIFRTFGIEMVDMSSSVVGGFQYGRCETPYTFNEKVVRNNGILAFQNVVHQTCYMLLEEALYSYNGSGGELASNYIEALRTNIYCVSKDKEYELVELPISGTMYINRANCGSKTFDKLMRAFYNLNIMNRYASEVSEKYTANIFGKESAVTSDVDKHVKILQERYNIAHMSSNEICLLLDSVQRKLYNNVKPENELEAKIMYDMAVSLVYAHDKISGEKCCEMLEKKLCPLRFMNINARTN